MVIITIIKVINMTILDVLKKQEARKIFGDVELKIIEKQLWGINLTQSEKNRLSRDVRKKLDFIKDIARYEDEFNLKKSSRINQLIQQTLGIILDHPLSSKIKRIYLFGSATKNQLTFRSDIDIAVEFTKIDLTESTRFRKRISGEVSDKIDIQVFEFLPEKIQKEIKKTGKVIFSCENKDKRDSRLYRRTISNNPRFI